MTEKTEQEKDEYVQWYVNMAVEYAKSIGLKDEVIEEVKDRVLSLRDSSWLGHDDAERYVEQVMERHRHRYLLKNDESYRIGQEEEDKRHNG